MLVKCHLLNEQPTSLSDDLIISTVSEFFFKMQKIVTFGGDVIGYEILLDFQKAQQEMKDGVLVYTQAINDGRSLDYLLNIMLTKKPTVSGKKMFINVERMNLCNKMLLRKIVATARHLQTKYDIDLVVEITERNPCGYCVNVMHGLLYLKKSHVSLAADDFDIYRGDFREKEIDTGLYDFIKVDMPKSQLEAVRLNEFIHKRNENIIVEMVENHEKIMFFGVSGRVYGYQGFAYP